ncbi:endonuclease/exonuclease/phosphatase family protein [Algoriphagus halophilus]|uniref:endonuclease/exonuclease/phosphatase family protein n=1 Tax=Algoriphagus halophilus TaxID=226505 RepID=UPI00358E0A43
MLKIIFTLALLIPIISNAQTLKVMSYNIHHGATREEKLSIREIGDFILKSQVDIVGLQEVDSVCNRSGKQDQMKILAQITKMHPLFARHFAYDGGAYGLGILSKFPLEEVRNDRILSVRPNGDTSTLAFLSAKVQLASGRTVRFATAHLALDHPTRMTQVSQILMYLGGEYPVVLTGDFNTLPNSPEIELLKTRFQLTQAEDDLTFPEKDPTKKIDYIFIDQDFPQKTFKKQVYLGNHLSDHLPIQSEIRFH